MKFVALQLAKAGSAMLLLTLLPQRELGILGLMLAIAMPLNRVFDLGLTESLVVKKLGPRRSQVLIYALRTRATLVALGSMGAFCFAIVLTQKVQVASILAITILLIHFKDYFASNLILIDEKQGEGSARINFVFSATFVHLAIIGLAFALDVDLNASLWVSTIFIANLIAFLTVIQKKTLVDLGKTSSQITSKAIFLLFFRPSKIFWIISLISVVQRIAEKLIIVSFFGLTEFASFVIYQMVATSGATIVKLFRVRAVPPITRFERELTKRISAIFVLVLVWAVFSFFLMYVTHVLLKPYTNALPWFIEFGTYGLICGTSIILFSITDWLFTCLVRLQKLEVHELRRGYFSTIITTLGVITVALATMNGMSLFNTFCIIFLRDIAIMAANSFYLLYVLKGIRR